MAVNKIYYAEFTDVRGTDWRVDIYKNPQGTITAKEFVCGSGGFALNYSGGEDLFSPLLPSTCTVPFIVQTAADQQFITDLFTLTEGQYLVDVVKDPDGADALYWRGFLTSDNLTIPDAPRPYTVELQAVDGLQTLSRETLTLAGPQTLLAIFQKCLDGLPTADLYTEADAFFRHATDFTTTGLTGDKLANLKAYVNDANVFTGELITQPTKEEALTQFCLLFNARLLLVEGVWTLQPLSRVLDGQNTFSYSAYGKTLNVATGGSYLALKTLETSGNKLAGAWSINFLPPIRRIARDLNYLGNRPLAGVFAQGFPSTVRINNQTTPPAAEVFSVDIDTTFPAGQEFTLRGTAQIEQGYVGGSDPLCRYRLNVEVKVGNLYLSRPHNLSTETTTVQSEFFEVNTSDKTCLIPDEPGAAVWTTNNADRFQIISDVLNSDLNNPTTTEELSDFAEISFSITTPPLPSAQDVDVTVICRAYGLASGGGALSSTIADEANITMDPQFFAGSGGEDDAVTFATSVDNGASEEYTLEPASSYGETQNAVNFGTIYISGGTQPTGFTSSLTTASTPIVRLGLIDRLRHQQTPQELRTGQIFSDQNLTPLHVLAFDSKEFAIISLTFQAYNALYNVQCVKVDESAGPVTDTDTDGNTVSLLPRPNTAQNNDTMRANVARDIRNVTSDVADVVSDVAALASDVADIKLTTDGDGGDSVVQLQYLGDVKISGPTNGQLLQYNTAASRWANVASTVVSLAGADQQLSAARKIDLNGNALTLAEGNTAKLVVSDAGGVEVFGDFIVDSGAVAGAELRLQEADLLGDHAVILKAPISLTADVALTLPTADGSNGQALTTNGSGTLSFGDVVAKVNPVVNNTLTIRPVTTGLNTQIYLKGSNDAAGVYIKAADAIASDVTFTLPSADGSAGDLLQTDGSGALSFGTRKSYHIIASSFYAADGNGDYIPIGGTLSETTSSNYYTIWTAPCAGRVVKATAIVSATTAGATTLTVRKYPIPQVFASASHTFSATLTTGTFTFGSSATFAAGDRLQFRFDPTGRPNGVQLSILLELTHE